MNVSRRELLKSSAGAAALMSLPQWARAQTIELTTYNWGSADEAAAYAAAFERFSAEFGDVKVVDNITVVQGWADYADKLITQIAGGNAPDLINIAIEGVRLAVAKGLLAPLDDLVAASPKARGLLDKIPRQLKEALSVDGKLYEIPAGWQVMVIYYNTRMFDAAGVPRPRPGWTWDDFVETAKALTRGEGADKVYGYGMPWFDFAHHPWYLTNGTYPVTDDYAASNLTDPKMAEAATFLHDLVHVHGVSPDPFGLNVYDQFANGRLAMTSSGRWPVPGWVKGGFTDFDIAPWPSKETGQTVFGCAGWGVSPESKHPELAFNAILELVSLETVVQVMEIGTAIPIYREAAERESFLAAPPNARLFHSAIEQSRPVASPRYFNSLVRIVERAMDEIITRSASPADALASADRELTRAIRRF